MDWYYAPWQYELRERIPAPRMAATVGRRYQIPEPITAIVLAGAIFLAYAPLLQPSPPAKTPIPGMLPIYNVGRFVV